MSNAWLTGLSPAALPPVLSLASGNGILLALALAAILFSVALVVMLARDRGPVTPARAIRLVPPPERPVRRAA